jgi:hypothetical protein
MIHARQYPSAISGVLYAEDFDEPLLREKNARTAGPPPTVRPEVIAPSFSLDDLRAATDQAHEEGRELGRETITQSLVVQHNAALSSLAEQLALSQEQSRQIVERALDAIAQTALSILAVALPALCANHAEDELRALLRRVLPPTRQLPELHIQVHPALREAVEGEVGVVFEGFGTKVTWTESSKLALGDIAVTWQNGSALRNTADTCAQIHNAVLALFNKEHETFVPEIHDVQ